MTEKEKAKTLAEDFINNMPPEQLASLKTEMLEKFKEIVAAESDKLNMLLKQRNDIEARKKELRELEKVTTDYNQQSNYASERLDLGPKVHHLDIEIMNQQNAVLALEHGGDFVTFTDKKGILHERVPYFVPIGSQLIGFSEDNILTEPQPPYIPLINEDRFRSAGYLFDAIRISKDEYLLATTIFSEKNSEYKNVIVTLDQLVLINQYYFIKAKATAQKYADDSTERALKYYLSLPAEKREKHFNQTNYYKSLPVAVKKKVTEAEWLALDLAGKEELYKPHKKYGSKRITSKLEDAQMWSSFHAMYERFVNPLATPRKASDLLRDFEAGKVDYAPEQVEKFKKYPTQTYGNREVFEYWYIFRDMMKWKIKDIASQREDISETRKAALETSFGDSSVNTSLQAEYGILVKRQNGSEINATEIEQLRTAWVKVLGTIGNLTLQAKETALKISHTGDKYVFASQAAGVYISYFRAIGVTNKFGNDQLSNFMAHEVGHWIDNKLGEKRGGRYLTDFFEESAAKLAFEFRNNMNEKSDSNYTNATKECFARALEQYFAIKNYGNHAETVVYKQKNAPIKKYIVEADYVSLTTFNEKIKPMIEAFLTEHADFFGPPMPVSSSVVENKGIKIDETGKTFLALPVSALENKTQWPENPGTIRFHAQKTETGTLGKKLSEQEKRELYKSIVDVYKLKNNEKEFKGFDSNGNEKTGYVYAPDLFEKSEITGKMLRYYILIKDENGKTLLAHPSEIYGNVSVSEIDRIQNNREYHENQAENQYKKVVTEIQKHNDVARVANAIKTALEHGATLKKEYDSADMFQVNPSTYFIWDGGDRHASIPEYVINTTGSYMGYTTADMVKQRVKEHDIRWLGYHADQMDWERFLNEFAQPEIENIKPQITDTPATMENQNIIDLHKADVKRIHEGTISVAEYKAAFERLNSHKEQVIELLNSKKKEDLLKMLGGMGQLRYKNENKARVVNAVWNHLLDDFIFDSISYTMGENYEDVFKRKIDKADEKYLADYAATVKKNTEEYIASRNAIKKAIENPETLDEFRTAIDYKGKAYIQTLSAEKQELYDDLISGTTKEIREKEKARRAVVAAVDLGNTSMNLIETKHTKHGYDLFVVQLADRVEKDTYNDLNSKAKRLSGWYSSYNKGGAIPGFQFKEKEQAQKFMALQEGDVDNLDKVQEREANRLAATAEKLNELGEKTSETADEKLNQDRLTNTHRRATMAGHAEESALKDKQLGQTLQNLADAIASGKAKYLDGVKTKTHVELLSSLLSQAKHKELNKKYPEYRDYLNHKGEPATIETVAFLESGLYPKLYLQNIKTLVNEVKNKPGAKLITARWTKWITKAEAKNIEYLTPADARSMNEVITMADKAKLSSYDTIKNQIDIYKRLRAMGIENDSMLRSALREFVQYRAAKGDINPIKALEREIVGTNTGIDFFPTPTSEAKEMVELADIEPGMDVLEPSAGNGNIAEEIRAAGVEPDVIEISDKLRKILGAKGFNVIGYDFMIHDFEGKLYDRIIMNPPFSDSQDIKHVQFAYELLKPGGRLVAIMGEGAFFRSDRKALDFQNWIDVNGTSEKLAANTFTDKKLLNTTAANARRVIINKPVDETAISPETNALQLTALQKLSDICNRQGLSINNPTQLRQALSELSFEDAALIKQRIETLSQSEVFRELKNVPYKPVSSSEVENTTPEMETELIYNGKTLREIENNLPKNISDAEKELYLKNIREIISIEKSGKNKGVAESLKNYNFAMIDRLNKEVVSNGKHTNKGVIEALRERKNDNAIHADIWNYDGYNVRIFDNSKTITDKKFKTYDEAAKFYSEYTTAHGAEFKKKYDYGTIMNVASIGYTEFYVFGNVPDVDSVNQNKTYITPEQIDENFETQDKEWAEAKEKTILNTPQTVRTSNIQSGNVSTWDALPVNWRNTKPINEVKYINSPYDKGLQSIFKDYFGTDELRPQFSCFNFDEAGITVTNANILLHLPYPNKKYEGIYATGPVAAKFAPKTKNDLFDGKYPNYAAVIPKAADQQVYQISVYKLLQYTRVAQHYTNRITHQVAYKFSDMFMGFNSEYLITVLESALKLGHEKLYAFVSAPNRAMLLSPDKKYTVGKSEIMLIMPVMLLGEDYAGAVELDFNRSLTVYYDFADNNIHNADGTVAEFKMNYGEYSLVSPGAIKLLNYFRKAGEKHPLVILNYFSVTNGTIYATDLDNSVLMPHSGLTDGLYQVIDGAIEFDAYANPGDYPVVPEIEASTYQFVIPSAILNYYLERAIDYTGNDELRPVMSGFNLHHTGGKLFIVATNAHILFKADITKHVELPANAPEFSFILPKEVILQFLDFAGEDYLVVKGNKTNSVFECSIGKYIARNIDGKYPTYDQAIPKQSTKQITLNIKDLYTCIKSAEAVKFTKDNKKDDVSIYDRLGSTEGTLDIYLGVSVKDEEKSTREITRYKMDREVKICTVPFTYTESEVATSESTLLLMPKLNAETNYFCFSPKFFKQVLDTCSSEDVTFEFTAPNRAYTISGQYFLYGNTVQAVKAEQKKAIEIVETAPPPVIDEPVNNDPERTTEATDNLTELAQIQEAIEFITEMLSDLKGKDKKEAKEAIEFLTEMLADV